MDSPKPYTSAIRKVNGMTVTNFQLVDGERVYKF